MKFSLFSRRFDYLQWAAWRVFSSPHVLGVVARAKCSRRSSNFKLGSLFFPCFYSRTPWSFNPSVLLECFGGHTVFHCFPWLPTSMNISKELFLAAVFRSLLSFYLVHSRAPCISLFHKTLFGICRVVDNDFLLTMDDGRSALKALELDGKEVKYLWGVDL